MLGSPWDQGEVRLLKDSGDHLVTGIAVLSPRDDDPRFALQFETSAGRVLRLRLPDDRLVQLGTLLLQLAQAQRRVRSTDDGGEDGSTGASEDPDR
jgi:hypothetical protein